MTVEHLFSHGSKHRGEPRFFLTKRHTPGHGCRVTADDVDNDSFYLAPVEIGSPSQRFFLDLDTGSADL